MWVFHDCRVLREIIVNRRLYTEPIWDERQVTITAAEATEIVVVDVAA